ncbi:Vancomycin B-type resistance protein VanW [Minicystis rosea]|nr:Vancomycin B-type resistance protein VanW [Minicystis rosea]
MARGVRLGGIAVAAGQTPRAAAEVAARRALDRRVTLTWAGAPILEVTVADLGGTVDVDALARAVEAVGRRGDVMAQLDDVLEARRGAVDVPVHVSLPAEPLAARLARIKEEHDTAPLAAKLDVAHHTATAHAPGRYLDVYGAVDAIGKAIAAAAPTDAGVTAAAPAFEIAPRASSTVVAAIDVSTVVSRFETRFGYLGDQAGRAQNIQRAAEQIEGVVLMPGEVVGFNANVGARSVDNGFAEAPEIYKGELRPGIGGGTCQVSGTLHAAAYMAGVDIVERANHSRPSGYIRMGLDATVVYPTVDLKLRNPYDFPIVVHGTIDKGSLVFELLGARHPATVTFETETVGTAPFKRKIEEVAGIAEGQARLKQKGIRGYSIKKTRVIHLEGGRDRIEVTTDVYPPTFEIYQVAPGTDVETVLPPLSDDRTAKNDTADKPALASSGTN